MFLADPLSVKKFSLEQFKNFPQKPTKIFIPELTVIYLTNRHNGKNPEI
jgi:hypothetical protein